MRERLNRLIADSAIFAEGQATERNRIIRVIRERVDELHDSDYSRRRDVALELLQLIRIIADA